MANRVLIVIDNPEPEFPISGLKEKHAMVPSATGQKLQNLYR
jgi:hypothetical protein